MPPITEIQTPDPQGIPISVPNIVTSLNTDTGPTASPSAFGADFSGLASGMSELASGSADLAQRHQDAKDSLWALDQTVQMDKTWSQQLLSGPTDPSQFDASFQKDLQGRLAAAPTERAGILLQRSGAETGMQYFRHNLYLNGRLNVARNDQALRDAAASVVGRVIDGTMAPADASRVVDQATSASAPAAPSAGAINQQAQSSIAQAQITNVAKTQGPDVAAAAVRGGMGAPHVDPISGEILATNLDNQAQNDVDARQRVAQKVVDGVQSKIANGLPVTPQEGMNAATMKAQADTAAPINSNPPSLVDFVQGARARLTQVEQGLSNRADLSKISTMREIANGQLGLLTQQRMLGMNPDLMQAQVQDLADAFGPNDPVVRQAAAFSEQAGKALMPGTPNFDPAGMAMKLPDVRTAFVNAQQTVASALTQPDGPDKSTQLGQGQQLMQTAIEKSFAAQRRMGVSEENLQPIPAYYARALGGAMDKPESIKANLTAIQGTYGDYAPQVISQAFGARNKGSTPGVVQLALLNPNSDTVWAAATFKDKLDPEKDKATADALKAALKNNSTFNNYFLGQTHNLGSAQDAVDWGSGLVQMAHYYMNQNRVDAPTAMNMAVADTIGSAYSSTRAENGHQLILPKTLAQTDQDGSDLQQKANVAMLSMSQPGAQQEIQDISPAGQKLDQGTLWRQVTQNGYWAYDPKGQTMTRYRKDPRGDAPVFLADGRPLAFDADGLKASAVVSQSPAGSAQSLPMGAPIVRLNTDLNNLIPAAPAPPRAATPPVVAPPEQQAPAHPTKVTQYGYPGDSTPDRNTDNGIGMAKNPLTANVAALSPSMEAKLNAKPGDTLKLQSGSGNTRYVYFGDRTSQQLTDDRVDLYNPDGFDGSIGDGGTVVNLGGGRAGLTGTALAAVGEHNVRKFKKGS